MKSILLLFFVLIGCAKEEFGIPPVQDFDVSRYLGRWYEIARLDNRFEKDCISATADYSMKDESTVSVVNTCYKSDQTIKIAKGVAKFKDDKGTGFLRVSFFRPFYGDYKIIILEENYNYAVIESGKNYLWILAREKELEKAVLDKIIEQVKEFKVFETDKLIFSK